MKRRTYYSHEDYIKKAVKILDRFCPKNARWANLDDDGEPELGEILLRRLNFLLDERRDAAARIERLEKELAVFRNVNAETSHLLERKIEELSMLRLITDTTSHAIVSHDPFKPILDKVLTMVGADSGCVSFLNSETGRFEMRAASCAEESQANDALESVIDEMAGHVVSAGKPYLIDDTRKDPRLKLQCEKHGIVSLASFPLQVEDRIIGVLNVTSPYPGAFDAETERIMHIITAQIAIAVQNARLYAEVRKTKEYLENLVERAGDAIFTLDCSHRISSWNKGAEAIFRRDKESVLGMSIYEFLPEELRPMLQEQICSILDSESIVTTEADAVTGSGEITQIALTLSPIRDEDGEAVGVSGIAKDITERKRVEEELRQLNAAKSNFVSIISHELRTPLTSIKSYIEILLHDMASLQEETVTRYLSIMNDECDHLSGMITSLLDLQKLEAGMMEVNLQPILLADIVRQAADLFYGVALPNRIELTSEFTVPDEETRILGDRKRLLQILSNLISNAFKYTDLGGLVHISLSREDEGIKLTVADDGIGIPMCETEKVFDKFYQVDNPVTRAKGGTGLGLAITKELVALHNGRIWVESQEGKGCRFNVLIPAAK